MQVGYFRTSRTVKGKRLPPLCQEVHYFQLFLWGFDNFLFLWRFMAFFVYRNLNKEQCVKLYAVFTFLFK